VILVPVAGDVRAPCLEPFSTFDVHANDWVQIVVAPGQRGTARDRAWERLGQEIGAPMEAARRAARCHLDDGFADAWFVADGRWLGDWETPIAHSVDRAVPFDLQRTLRELADAARAAGMPGFDELCAILAEMLVFSAGRSREPELRLRRLGGPAARPGVRVEEVVLRRPRPGPRGMSPGVRIESIRPTVPPSPAPGMNGRSASTPVPEVPKPHADASHTVEAGACIRCGKPAGDLSGPCPGPTHGRMGMIELD